MSKKPLYFDEHSIHMSDAVKRSLNETQEDSSITAPYFSDPTKLIQIEKAYEDIYRFIGAHPDDKFCLTSCAEEAIAQVLQSVYIDHMYPSGKNQFVTLQTSDAETLFLFDRYKQIGCDYELIPVNSNGHLTVDILKMYINPKVALVSLPWVNRLTGVVQPIWEIAEYCKSQNILLHVDATDILGRSYFQYEDMPIDFLTFDGARLCSVPNVGVLFVKAHTQIGALIPSGHQDLLRGGRLNHQGLIALSVALNELGESIDHTCIEIARLRNHFEKELKERTNAKVILSSSERIPTKSCMSFFVANSEMLLFSLSQANTFASFGGGDVQKLEHILTNIGYSALEANSALSFTFPMHITEEDVNSAIERVQVCINHLSKISNAVLREENIE